ncbi:hypothetical protein Y032_0076g992 [Ancylostoma ceylanicum]|nr:hypothetical protein Y032_0076g992 [Ancylostoma ceylanicum]
MIMLLLLFFLVFMLSPSLQQPVYVSNPTNPPHGCSNYGICADPVPTVLDIDNNLYYYSCPSSECICNNGTTGSSCADVINKCDPDPCPKANGSMYSCTNGVGNYMCECQPGYTGASCESSVNSICASNPCLNGGTCSSSDNVDYKCACAAGYVGIRCQYKNPCDKVNCVHGVCEPIFDGADFYCRCEENWQQVYCGRQKYLWSGSPVNEGCFEFKAALDDPLHYKRISDPAMTVTKCQQILTSQNGPIYTMFTLSGTNCYLSNTSFLNTTRNDNNCQTKCVNSNEICAKLSQRAIVYTYDTVEYDSNACENRTLCNADLAHGECIDMAPDKGGHTCKCDPAYTGNECETPKPGPCDSSPCLNGGTCFPDALLGTYRCECALGYCGTVCEFELQCKNNTCLHGGSCIELYNGKYQCQCLQYYHGEICQELNTCDYSNNCINGTCQSIVNGIVPGSTCLCIPGYTGEFCDIDIDDCASSPCVYGICTDMYMDYNCTCVKGADGKNCDIDLNDCVEYTEDGKKYPNRCVTKDAAAKCNDRLAGFTCKCSPMWTGEYCDLNVIIRDVLLTIYGEVNLEMIPMLEDLMRNPSQIKDMVPFIVGLQEDDNRTGLSWEYADMFHWAAFEEKRLELERDLYKWNDVVLGNCFTFNHRTSNFNYKMRSSGVQGGLQALMNVGSHEYVPWFDTAAILVFVHNKDEYVFSESVRYNAQPDGETLILVRDVSLFASRGS